MDSQTTLPSPSQTLPDSLCTALEARMAHGTIELPLLPHVASQVLALSASADSSAQALAALIHRDQAIAANVLRVANSPLYRPRVPIVSLQQAISRLGLQLLRDIVISISMRSRVFNVPSYAAEARALWHHAVETAAYAREIARQCRRNVEGAFLSGLLHDVSKPVLLLALADIQGSTATPLPPETVALALDVYHTRVGALLASTWALPAETCASLIYHHDYQAAPAHTDAVMLTSLADRVSYTLSQADAELDSLTLDPLWSAFNMYPDDVAHLLERREAIAHFVAAIG
ncbi:MAG: HDOD domain-containing protein [Candidatus Tectimicrobiota bacterium]